MLLALQGRRTKQQVTRSQSCHDVDTVIIPGAGRLQVLQMGFLAAPVFRMRAKKGDRAIKGATAETPGPTGRNGDQKIEIKLYFRTNLGCRLFEYKVPVGPQ